MSELPSPLTPADCDLRDFPFMPLDVQRLRRSKAWLKAKRTPALAFYMINLWTASWHDVPTGSLEDDDDVLADLAMCDPVKWDKLRKDVLHGWIKCSDGRLYNPTVAEKAMQAWDSKLDQKWRTECARIKKHNDRNGTTIPRPTFEEWMSQGCPSGQRLPVPRDNSGTGNGQGGETGSNREGEGEGHREGEGDSINHSVPDGTDAGASGNSSAEKSAEQLTKDELWAAGKSLLMQAGMPKAQCGSYVGKLVKDYGDQIVIDAVRTAVVERPADAASFLKATCQTLAGQRTRPNKQEQLEAKNRQIAERLAREGS
ncbi:DUF1376 domain-containing protein [Trinickia sp.]|uniref:DUF1376 domain-containing protein n=1 Tax=Trinickia sp. TaxID=2571163 RepID=UPI003F7FF77B